MGEAAQMTVFRNLGPLLWVGPRFCKPPNTIPWLVMGLGLASGQTPRTHIHSTGLGQGADPLNFGRRCYSVLVPNFQVGRSYMNT